MLDTGPWLQAAAALAAVLGPLWLAARALGRRQGGAARPGRRLALLESLALDPRRRLLLIRCDGREALLLTGGTEDRMLGWLPPEQAP
ncbi:flagellar biosynthetic protein FliO [Siccirubricoccus sp. KC 17139]|uniref:Flagellar biosynthetic protein FliO n=1 Tax=Siccirubricoccus soli TaxID=2899147 RepID=A0ABT1DD94_9PROT|nr:flagellar biosynthetic protein FliO [Siccirubricoccus soli]MCO6419903.1 flagellar biosynthetic protein FliO [Siccirubricoccus soli]MCP2686038.1 flagellar biosynthetic protein FliO [Siccirubricoccus soli]